MQYTLQYINRCGDTIARDYFDNKEEAIEFMNELIDTYKRQDADTGLLLEDDDGSSIAEYYKDWKFNC